jgi:ATP-dependent RNA helicase DDX19/DBP5
VKIQVTLADQQADPNSPLFSAKSFEDLNLHPNLLKGVYKMGFQKPSKIQEKALPLLLQNPCVFFSLLSCLTTFPSDTRPLILNLTLSQSPEHDRSVSVCIAPSRELAMQILHVVQRMGEYTPVECFFAGKDSFKKGMPKLTAQIVIGTPGTMIDVR